MAALKDCYEIAPVHCGILRTIPLVIENIISGVGAYFSTRRVEL